jgi:acyl phosphate:glycerol-3-phosphate acyltransferase
MMELGLKFTLAYLLGSVLGGVLLGRLRGIDLRRAGSGNPGSTNALRTQGKLFALGVLTIDVGKGIVALLLVPALTLPAVLADPGLDPALLMYMVGFAVVLGHVFPVFSNFAGGKGGATAAGVLVFVAPSLAVWVLLFWILVIGFTGYVGLATIAAAVGAATVVGLTRLPEQHGLFLFAVSVAALIVYTHRANIARMLAGNENRQRRFLLGR